MEENAEVQVNRKNMAAWVAALRSGEWEQASGALACRPRQEGARWGFCCLGVATELMIQDPEAPTLRVRERENLIYTYRVYESDLGTEGLSDTCSGSLHPLVMRWLGVSSGDPLVVVANNAIATRMGVNASSKPRFYLSRCNDRYELTFAEIADLIEATYLTEETP